MKKKVTALITERDMANLFRHAKLKRIYKYKMELHLRKKEGEKVKNEHKS